MQDFIRQIPKSDLHVHLDGSVRIPTLIEIAQTENLPLPSYTEAGLNELLFKDNYANLSEYLACFGRTIPALQTPENLERVACEFALDNQAEGVCYVEVRFAPQFHVNRIMDVESALRSVTAGLERAAREYNSQPAVRDGTLPSFQFGIIACAMRSFGHGFSEYFDMFLSAHRYSDPPTIHALASYELVRACVKARDKAGIPVVGFDLAGAEAGNPAEIHQQAYHYAHKHFMHLTVHAGEEYGAESIFQAITDLHADRIGHGYCLFDVEKISDPAITDPADYVRRLAQYIADRRITIEVCLTSNLQTNPAIGSIARHNFRRMLEAKLSCTLCTDNRTVSKTTASREIEQAVRTFQLHGETLKDLIIYGFKRSFFPGTYAEKRRYVRQVIDRYELLARQHFHRPERT